MKVGQRARMPGIVTAMVAVIGGTGFAVGTVTAEPGSRRPGLPDGHDHDREDYEPQD